MADIVSNDILTPDEAVKSGVNCICIVLDQDIINGLQKLEKTLGFPIGHMVSESLRPFVNTFMPLADLQEQGKLTPDYLSESVKSLDSMILRADIAKARFDKNYKNLEKQQKINRGERNERKGKSST
jgi:hypothetical protein